MNQTDPTTPLSREVEIFETRSKNLRRGAYAFLAAIVVLIIAGGVVFRFAEQITTSDLNGNVEKSIQANNDEINNLQAESQTLGSEFEPSRLRIRDVLVKAFSEVPKVTTPMPKYETLRFDQVPLSDITSDWLANHISDFTKASTADPVRMWVVFFSEIGNFEIPKSKLYEIAQGLKNVVLNIPTERLKANQKRQEDIGKRVGFLIEVNKILHSRLVSIAAGLETPPVGDVVAKGNDGLYRLIQTNITRFGTLAVITFLIMILVPLYRYNMRLSAFYLARSDALRIRQSEILGNIAFEALTAALSPGIDFGKMPPTPTEQIINLFRSVSKADEH